MSLTTLLVLIIMIRCCRILLLVSPNAKKYSIRERECGRWGGRRPCWVTPTFHGPWQALRDFSQLGGARGGGKGGGGHLHPRHLRRLLFQPLRSASSGPDELCCHDDEVKAALNYTWLRQTQTEMWIIEFYSWQTQLTPNPTGSRCVRQLLVLIYCLL